MRTKLVLTLPALLMACSGTHASVGNSAQGTRNFTVGAFDAVALQGADDVKVVTGPTVSVVATGPQDQLDKLDIRVEGSTLKIGRQSGYWHMNWGGKGVTVTVTTPGIKKASIGGSGDLSVDRVANDAFEGSVAGSGDLDVAAVQVKNAQLSIAGSGNIRIAGTTQSSSISIAGSGDVEAERLTAQTADLSIAGSGNIRTLATGSAKISLVGSGDAFVKGTKDCTVSKIGSGEGRCEP